MSVFMPVKTAFVIVLLFFFAGIFSGCGGVDTTVITITPEPPPTQSITGFTASQGDGTVILSWTNPTYDDFAGVMIRRGALGFPDSPDAPDAASDTVVFNGLDNTFTDTSVETGSSYYYSAFGYDRAAVYSERSTQTVTVIYLPFTLVALPDTQYYSLDYPTLFSSQTQWVVDHAEEKNIKYVLHEGDVVHKNTDAEWENAASSMFLLDGVVPYAISVGNHDYDGDRDTTRFNTYFPRSKYAGYSWFGGSREPDSMDNTYHFFTAGGADWLVLALEYNPRDEVLEWARGIVEMYPHRKVILDTHAYLYPDDTRHSIGNNVWDKLVRKYKNFIFVVNGHYTDSEAARLVSEGDNGNKVYQMFANYQTWVFGGQGYMRIIEVIPEESKVKVRSFSSWHNDYLEDSDNQFEFDNVDLASP